MTGDTEQQAPEDMDYISPPPRPLPKQAPGLDWDAASRKMIEQAQEERGTAGSTSALARDIAQCVENAGWWPDDVRIAMNLPPLGDRHPVKDLQRQLAAAQAALQVSELELEQRRRLDAEAAAELASSQHGYKLLADHAEKQAGEIAKERAICLDVGLALHRANAEIAALKQRLEQSEKDAARYRWLRDKQAYVAVQPHHTLLPRSERTGWTIRLVTGNDENMDAAVDAASQDKCDKCGAYMHDSLAFHESDCPALAAEPPVRKCICEVPPQGLPRMADPDCPLHGDPAIIGEPPGGQQEQGND